MARFTVRIELHQATWQNYVDLAKALGNHGIVDVIRSDDGLRYKLPPAEYNYEGQAGASDVLNTAARCAAGVAKSYAVFVTEAGARLWRGLCAA